jgi:hypothetical protein
MSHVDNVILTFSILEDEVERDGSDVYPVMDAVNEWLRERIGQSFGPDLGGQHAAYGGHKALETPMFVAAFNGLPEDGFLALLATLPWEWPDDVQVLIQRQHDERFEILTPLAASLRA